MPVRKFFGTDGIRGKANREPITPTTVLKIGMAAGSIFKAKNVYNRRPKIVLGKDTRLSGYMLENAIVSGLIAVGVDVILLGPMPTPSVSMLIRSMKADGGMMITASHNPYQDNGIKIFGHDGYKISDEDEAEIENLLERTDELLSSGEDIGKAVRLNDAQGRYIEMIKHTFPEKLTLEGMRIVLDCANGAGYKVAPTILRELGADVITIGVDPDGKNINKNCGSMHPEFMCEEVVKHGADVGIALDGDGDRYFLCDEKGHELIPCKMIGLIARSLKAEGRLKGNKIVGTILSNLGLEQFLKNEGLELVRTKVGERFVVEEMRKIGANFGGEHSGHTVMLDYATGGDGLLISLLFLAIMLKEKKPASAYQKMVPEIPQKILYVYLESNTEAREAAEKTAVLAEVEKLRKDLGAEGRVVIRPSGTAPAVMLMVAHPDKAKIDKGLKDLETVIKNS